LALTEIIVKGKDALKLVASLNATSFKIFQLLSEERLDVSMIAERLGLSEAYISERIHTLEELKIVDVEYERGIRGIRKMCKLAVQKITIAIK
jgi:predicted transcriptional regulator